MKILHTADWHLGQNFYGYDRTNEHRDFLEQIEKIVQSEKPDALLLCGDIFHAGIPSSSVRRLYTDALLSFHKANPSMQIIVIAGNHDSSAYLEADGRLWDLARVKVFGRNSSPEDQVVPIEVDGVVKGIVAALPFSYAQNYKGIPDDTPVEKRREVFIGEILSKAKTASKGTLPIVIMGHDTVEECDLAEKLGEVGGLNPVSIKEFEGGFDYMALGHIHKSQQRLRPDGSLVRYSGSPLSVDFGEEKYFHSVSIVEIEKRGDTPAVREIPITQKVPLVRFPEKPIKDMAELKKAIGQIPSDKVQYITIVLDSDAPFTAQDDAEIKAILDGTSSMVCRIRRDKGRKRKSTSEMALSVDEFTSKSPLEIASTFYEKRHGRKIPEYMMEMLQKIYSEVIARERGQEVPPEE